MTMFKFDLATGFLVTEDFFFKVTYILLIACYIPARRS